MSTPWPSTTRPMVRLLYLYRPIRIHCPTSQRWPWSLQWYTPRPETQFRKVHFLSNFFSIFPVNIKPGPCVTEACHGSACKISRTWHLSRGDCKHTLTTTVDYRQINCWKRQLTGQMMAPTDEPASCNCVNYLYPFKMRVHH